MTENSTPQPDSIRQMDLILDSFPASQIRNDIELTFQTFLSAADGMSGAYLAELYEKLRNIIGVFEAREKERKDQFQNHKIN